MTDIVQNLFNDHERDAAELDRSAKGSTAKRKWLACMSERDYLDLKRWAAEDGVTMAEVQSRMIAYERRRRRRRAN